MTTGQNIGNPKFQQGVYLEKRAQHQVICDHYGGPECEDCKFNHVTNGELNKRFFCQNAMNDLSGDTVTLVRL